MSTDLNDSDYLPNSLTTLCAGEALLEVRLGGRFGRGERTRDGPKEAEAAAGRAAHTARHPGTSSCFLLRRGLASRASDFQGCWASAPQAARVG